MSWLVGFSRVSISTGQSGFLSDGAFPIHITAQNRFFGQTISRFLSRQKPSSRFVAKCRDLSQNVVIYRKVS